ncbi:uncharacterized protein Bfra_010605 [Botrytis fragariae]|uniref:Uncharacterized protein n=1 Tax=Botrytis fragariae TaxID=1964551 RepID=A0A8H6EDA6_9HELO|nr:uncharacterized protein Bfra_010605 [Botrytis fragariae]KAF5867630.1 hypothetical protein Bfra_010605 [Botrytis fragariae]
MPASSHFGASRRVHFDTSITESPCNRPTVTRKHVNDEYYLRMVFAEKKMWIKSSMTSQDESEMSDQEERCEAQRHIQFEPETKTVHQHHHMNAEYYQRMVAIETKIRHDANVEIDLSDEESHGAQNHVIFSDALKTSACKSAEVTHKSKTEAYYHRMVAIESKMWKEANVGEQAGAGMLEEAPYDSQRRVKFQDSVSQSSHNSIKPHKNNAKNQLYDRMVKLETKIWIEGGDNTQGNADDTSEDEMSPIEANHFQSRNREPEI